MTALLPAASAESGEGIALAGVALYLLFFALGLWGVWALVKTGPADTAGPVSPGPPR